MGQCLEVSRGDLGVTRMAAAGTGPPRAGEALFTVERSWLHVVRHRGLGSAGELYQAVRAGRPGSPADAHVVDVAGD
jgi:hypothetical protein